MPQLGIIIQLRHLHPLLKRLERLSHLFLTRRHITSQNHSIAHGPGPPHLPHIPFGVELFTGAEATAAKTLSALAVSFDPHSGHITSCAFAAFFTSFSNLLSHFRQLYS